MHTGVFHEIDFAADQKWSGHLGIPFSIDRSPYFQLKIPVFRIKNGSGPKVLLMAGNHGDEYEGEMTLARLFRRLDKTAFAARRGQSQPRLPRRRDGHADIPPRAFPRARPIPAPRCDLRSAFRWHVDGTHSLRADRAAGPARDVFPRARP